MSVTATSVRVDYEVHERHQFCNRLSLTWSGTPSSDTRGHCSSWSHREGKSPRNSEWNSTQWRLHRKINSLCTFCVQQITRLKKIKGLIWLILIFIKLSIPGNLFVVSSVRITIQTFLCRTVILISGMRSWHTVYPGQLTYLTTVDTFYALPSESFTRWYSIRKLKKKNPRLPRYPRLTWYQQLTLSANTRIHPKTHDLAPLYDLLHHSFMQ